MKFLAAAGAAVSVGIAAFIWTDSNLTVL